VERPVEILRFVNPDRNSRDCTGTGLLTEASSIAHLIIVASLAPVAFSQVKV
jgi:hypothetical protein